MRREIWFVTFLVFILLALVLGDPPVAWRLQQVFYSGGAGNADVSRELVVENDVLLAELASLRDIKERLPSPLVDFVPALVYSRYPFVLKNELLISAGAGDGVSTGSGVFLALPDAESGGNPGALIGVVSETFGESAVVRTVFDQGFQMPVRIGERGVEGLLVGGAEPSVGLIRKDEVVSLGDIIYSAAPGVPYGFPVGRVARLRLSPDQIFTEAPIAFSYDMSTAHVVLVARDHGEN